MFSENNQEKKGKFYFTDTYLKDNINVERIRSFNGEKLIFSSYSSK